MSCDLSLSEHEPGDSCSDHGHSAALERRRGGAAKWSQIVRGRDGGGSRDFLDGKPIHCGTSLELQSLEYKSDDYGEYTLPLPTGTRVRYELAWDGDERAIMLHVGVGGHEFIARWEPWMRLRWPAVSPSR